MKLRVSFVLILLITAACSRPINDKDDTPKLRAMLSLSDGVIIKDFLGPNGITGPPMEPMAPGILSFEGITAQRANEESSKLKGVRVFVVSPHAAGERIPQHYSLLDEREARDLDAALTYMNQMQGRWAQSRPAHETEISFQSKDAFLVSLYFHNGKDELGISSGPEAFVSFPATDISKVQEKLRAALDSIGAK